MQTYCCTHCGRQFKDPFSLFLHTYTDKFHVDIGLWPWISKRLLSEFVPVGREIAVWEN